MSAANAHIGDWPGIQPPATDSDILRIVEGRLATSIINRLTALGLERSEINEVIIPSRTLHYRRSRCEKLTIEFLSKIRSHAHTSAPLGIPFVGMPDIVASQVDVLPAERRDMLEQGRIELP